MQKDDATPPEPEQAFRSRLLLLWEKMADQLVRLFLRQNILVPELEKILRWRATQAALTDPEFAVPNRDEEYQQTYSHAAVLTGLSRQEMAEAAKSESSPVELNGGSLHRMIRVLTAWRTEAGYQDENGAPIELPLRGPAPSFHQLCLKYGRDTPTRAIADAVVRNGNAEWIGESEGTQRDKKLRFIHPVVTGGCRTMEDVAILTQASNDFLHSLQQTFDETVSPRPRFREGYFNDIDVARADEALNEIHEEMQAFNVRCTELLKKYGAKNGEQTVRIGVGSYSFRNSPLLLITEAVEVKTKE